MIRETPPPAPAQSDAHPGARALNVARPGKKTPVNARFLPTLFDRLCDDAPLQKSESSDAYVLSRSDMKVIIQRDLSFLLNTGNMSDLLDARRHPHVLDSTINYGVPALAGSYLSEKKWADIELMIREAIRKFEPRLIKESLTVKPLMKDGAAIHYNVLTFEISGLVHMEPYPLEFIVQSAVDLETNRISFHER